MSARPRRLGLWIPWAVFAALALGWSLYWLGLAHAARTELNRLIDAQNAAGAEAHVGAVRTRGFPLQLALDLEDVRYTPAGAAARFSTPRLRVHVNPSNPQHLMFDFPAPVSIARSDSPFDATARVLQASLRYRRGALARAALSAEALRVVDQEDGAVVLEAASLLINVRPDPRAEHELQAAFTLREATLKAPVRGVEPLGRSIAALESAIVVEQADALVPRGDPFFAWRDAGGALRIEALRIAWGAAAATGTGRISLDAERRLAGALTLSIERPSETLNTLAANPELPAAAQANLRALALLNEGAPSFDAPLRAQDGALYLQQTFLRDLAPLYRPPS